jgi:hypothetical protein
VTFLKVVPAAVATGVAAPAARTAEQRSQISKHTLACGEPLSGVTFTDAEHEVMLPNVTTNREYYESIRRISIDDAAEPAFMFQPFSRAPRPGGSATPHAKLVVDRPRFARRPANDDESTVLAAALACERACGPLDRRPPLATH